MLLRKIVDHLKMLKPIHDPEDHNLNFPCDGNPKTHEKPLLYT